MNPRGVDRRPFGDRLRAEASRLADGHRL